MRARRQGRLRIGLDRPAAAAELLRRQGFAAVVDGAEAVELPACEPVQTAAVNRLLVERGFAVHSISQVQPTLEEMFLDVTQAS